MHDTEWLKADGRNTWDGVFRVEWLCRTPLPFARLPADLINRWNADKPIKIGFDGTEVPPDAGEQLKQLFLPSSAPRKAARTPRTPKENAENGGGMQKLRRSPPPQHMQD